MTRPLEAELHVVPVADGFIECESVGEGPTIVLIHGGLVDRRLWDNQVAALAGDHQVIRYDLRGLGRSSVPEGPFSHLDDLDRLLDALAVGLVLAAPGLRGYEWAPNPAIEAAYLLLSDDPRRGIALLLETGMGGATAESQALLHRMVTENLRGWSQAIPERMRWPSPPTLERLGEIVVPALVLVGTHDEPALREIANTIATVVPNASLITLPGAKHHLNLDRPSEFMTEVRRFLESV
jgi:3-oxoadipate enol-lactonase